MLPGKLPGAIAHAFEVVWTSDTILPPLPGNQDQLTSVSVRTCTRGNQIPAVVQSPKMYVDSVSQLESAQSSPNVVRLPPPDSSIVR